MRKGIKFRIYPNKEQCLLLAKTFGCCRMIYNKGLAHRISAYKDGEKANYVLTNAMLTGLKEDPYYAFLKEVDSIALQQALRDLDRAYTNFFKHLAKYPHFKSKKEHHFRYRTINQGNNIRIENGKIKLPKIGYVKIKQSMPVSNIHNVTVEQEPSGKYYVVINMEFEHTPLANAGGVVGIDLGIKTFYSDSNGNTVSNPKYLEAAERRLAKKQRSLSRKRKGSKNFEKQRIAVAKAHESVANKRKDFLHKEANKLINENQVICVEDLNVKGMIKNHKLAKHIASASWGEFSRIIAYKAEWNGNQLVKVPTFFPSSQTCSICGYQNKDVKNLAVRVWECPVCHSVHDRDRNAAINILNKGLEMTAS